MLELARAVPLVLSQVPSARFRFVGRSLPHPDTGEDLKAHLQRVLAPHMASVELVDAIPYEDIPNVLATSGICVFPSIWEASGFVCKEAMAAARAVVASDASGMAEIIDHGMTGLLVPPGDPGALAVAIIQFCENRNAELRWVAQRGRT